MPHTLMPPAARRAVGCFVAIALAAVATGLAWVTGRLAHISTSSPLRLAPAKSRVYLPSRAPRHRGWLGGLHSPFWSGTPRAPAHMDRAGNRCAWRVDLCGLRHARTLSHAAHADRAALRGRRRPHPGSAPGAMTRGPHLETRLISRSDTYQSTGGISK
jgi:hypothetical protein